jgi:hypothetical membrane protein
LKVPFSLPDWLRFFGMAGCLVPAASSLVAALLYRGKGAERYSPLNHFVSELGEQGVSRAAALFNGGLVAGGLAMIPFFAWLGLAVGGIWGILAAAAGIWASVSCALVGIYPMSKLMPHIRAATSYFRGGLAAVALWALGIWLGPVERVPRGAAAAGAAAAGVYTAFLIVGAIRYRGRLSASRGMSYLDPSRIGEDSGLEGRLLLSGDRPRVWLIPIMEWLVFAATVGCFFALSLAARCA